MHSPKDPHTGTWPKILGAGTTLPSYFRGWVAQHNKKKAIGDVFAARRRKHETRVTI